MRAEPQNALARDDPPQCLAQVLADECAALGHPAPAFNPDTSEDGRLAAIIAHINGLDLPRSALCLSGGGIRSATFEFGIIPRLAKAGPLTQFDFPFTVSGGGYLGRFLSAWAKAHPGKHAGMQEELAGEAERSVTEPEAKPVTHLRRFSNCTPPSLGLFSADA